MKELSVWRNSSCVHETKDESLSPNSVCLFPCLSLNESVILEESSLVHSEKYFNVFSGFYSEFSLNPETDTSSSGPHGVSTEPGGRLFCRHVGAGVVPVVPAAVRRSGSGRGKDGGEPLEAAPGPAAEPDPGSPHSPAGLGRGRVADGAERSARDEPGSGPGAAGVRGAVRTRRGGRIGRCGRDLALPRLPTGGEATAPGAVGRSDWSAGETPNSPVQPALAEGAAERPRRS